LIDIIDILMDKNPVKGVSKPQLAGLIVGTGLAASIQFGIRLLPIYDSFYSYTIILYFLASLIFGCFTPGLSWKGGIWLTVPWVTWIFFNIASTGFKDGILGSFGWLLLYSFPLVPASAGSYGGALTARLISFFRKR